MNIRAVNTCPNLISENILLMNANIFGANIRKMNRIFRDSRTLLPAESNANLKQMQIFGVGHRSSVIRVQYQIAREMLIFHPPEN